MQDEQLTQLGAAYMRRVNSIEKSNLRVQPHPLGYLGISCCSFRSFFLSPSQCFKTLLPLAQRQGSHSGLILSPLLQHWPSTQKYNTSSYEVSISLNELVFTELLFSKSPASRAHSSWPIPIALLGLHLPLWVPQEPVHLLPLRHHSAHRVLPSGLWF